MSVVIPGMSSTAEYWQAKYESKTFEADIELLFQQVRPLYAELHSYVRHKLRLIYGNDPGGSLPIFGYTGMCRACG
jgi:hypothetical protein